MVIVFIIFSRVLMVYLHIVVEFLCADMQAGLRYEDVTWRKKGMMPFWLDGVGGSSSTSNSKSPSHSPPCSRYHPYARKKHVYVTCSLKFYISLRLVLLYAGVVAIARLWVM
jgi:hypothetical protein